MPERRASGEENGRRPRPEIVRARASTRCGLYGQDAGNAAVSWIGAKGVLCGFSLV